MRCFSQAKGNIMTPIDDQTKNLIMLASMTAATTVAVCWLIVHLIQWLLIVPLRELVLSWQERREDERWAREDQRQLDAYMTERLNAPDHGEAA
jgi:hypothetical protein